MNPLKSLSAGEVADFALVGISLPLERDVSIRRVPVPILKQTENELKAVPNEEKEYQHLLLLTLMDFFMVDKLRCDCDVRLYDKPPHQHDGLIPLRGKPTASNYLHCLLLFAIDYQYLGFLNSIHAPLYVVLFIVTERSLKYTYKAAHPSRSNFVVEVSSASFSVTRYVG